MKKVEVTACIQCPLVVVAVALSGDVTIAENLKCLHSQATDMCTTLSYETIGKGVLVLCPLRNEHLYISVKADAPVVEVA